MKNDYECPKCHNVFPASNRIMHDARCTEENPMPLDQSRQMLLNNQNNPPKEEKKENIDIKNKKEKPPEVIPPKKAPSPKTQPKTEPQIRPQVQPQVQPQPEPLKKSSGSGEFPDIFVCEVCGETLALSEKKDHMFCHNLEREEHELNNNLNELQVSERQIEQQKQIERLIKQQNEMRRQNEQNQRSNQQNQIHREHNINLNGDRNNLLDSDTNILESDMQFLGNMGMRNNIPGFSQTRRTNTNTQNNPSGGQRMRIIRTTTGPNGETIIQQFGSDDSGEIRNMMMNNMNMNMPFQMFSTSSNSGRRMNIPFSNFSTMGGMDSFFQQILQNLGRHEHPTDQQILNELPETKIDDVSKLDAEKRNCVICLEDFKNGDNATVLPCIHLFHTDCIKNWLKTQNCCPICKFKLTGENLNSQP